MTKATFVAWGNYGFMNPYVLQRANHSTTLYATYLLCLPNQPPLACCCHHRTEDNAKDTEDNSTKHAQQRVDERPEKIAFKQELASFVAEAGKGGVPAKQANTKKGTRERCRGRIAAEEDGVDKAKE